MERAKTDCARSGLVAPVIFEVPHYAGSVNTYRAIATRFAARWERALYFPGLLRGTAPDGEVGGPVSRRSKRTAILDFRHVRPGCTR